MIAFIILTIWGRFKEISIFSFTCSVPLQNDSRTIICLMYFFVCVLPGCRHSLKEINYLKNSNKTHVYFHAEQTHR